MLSRPRLHFLAATLASALVFVPILLVPGTSHAKRSQASAPSRDALICRQTIRRIERSERIPAQLLAAISIVEAGRWIKSRSETAAWPWTVYAEGRGRYLPSKAAALAEIADLKSRGVSNIDVGCMQINLHHHGKAFRSIEEALDPKANVAYAAKFLVSLRQEARSWTVAMAHYHSRTPKFNKPYRKKVLAAWRSERKRAVGQRRALTKAKWEARFKARRQALYQRKLDLKARRFTALAPAAPGAVRNRR